MDADEMRDCADVLRLALESIEAIAGDIDDIGEE